MSNSFKITYNTTEDGQYALTIPKAFDYDETKPADAAKINAAANAILSANAIDTGDLGDLVSIASIEFLGSNVSEYEI